jgi:hypothetical protein
MEDKLPKQKPQEVKREIKFDNKNILPVKRLLFETPNFTEN